VRTAASKHLPLEALAAQLAAARAAGRRVALVSGGFALLHGAVVRHLTGVRATADVLVAVVVDGPETALAPAAERALVVGALRVVDYVLVSAREALPELRRRLQPDVDLPSPEDETERLRERLRQ
jgi:bifunctional ADP-heptose synthase (sugar kinase/adenylyltransferase)